MLLRRSIIDALRNETTILELHIMAIIWRAMVVPMMLHTVAAKDYLAMGIWFTGLQEQLRLAAAKPERIITDGLPLVMGRTSSTVFNDRRRLQDFLNYFRVSACLTVADFIAVGEITEVKAYRTTPHVPLVSKKMHENITTMLGGVCDAIHSKLQERARDLLPGGRYHRPTPETRARLRTAPSNNDASERSFGSLKYIMHNSPNMTLINARNIVILRSNDTLKDFLKLHPSDRERQLKVARQMRPARQKQNCMHEKGVLQTKALATRANRDKAVAAQGKRDQRRTKLISIKVATTRDEVILIC
jgi:hypothetical protein